MTNDTYPCAPRFDFDTDPCAAPSTDVTTTSVTDPAKSVTDRSADDVYVARVAPVDALQIEAPDGSLLLERTRQLALETKCRASGELILLSGPPMAGHADLIKQVANAPWLQPFEEKGKRLRPFVEIDARAQCGDAASPILEAIAGGGDGQKSTAARACEERRQLHNAVASMVGAGRLIAAIEHAEQILNGKDVHGLDAVAGKIGVLMANTKASFILTGSEGLLAFARPRLELLGAVSHFQIQPVSGIEELQGMIEAFELAGSLQPNPKLRSALLMGAILDLTQGLRGRIADLLREGVKAAIFDDVDLLTLEHLVKVVDRTPLAIGENPLLRYL